MKIKKERVKIIETRRREIDFVLWGHCQNLLEHRHEKPGFLHMRKQRRRSASR